MSNLFWYDIWNDGDVSWWTSDPGTLTEETIITHGGVSSLKIFADGAAAQIYHNDIWDLTGYLVYNFWWYGTNDSISYTLFLLAPDWENYWTKAFTNDFSGWRKESLYLSLMTIIGSPDISDVRQINLQGIDDGTTLYFNRIWLSRYGYDVARYST